MVVDNLDLVGFGKSLRHDGAGIAVKFVLGSWRVQTPARCIEFPGQGTR